MASVTVGYRCPVCGEDFKSSFHADRTGRLAQQLGYHMLSDHYTERIKMEKGAARKMWDEQRAEYKARRAAR